MKIVILNGLGDFVAKKCRQSILQTSNINVKDVFIIKEKDYREQTLNYALSVIGIDDDILFVGDDIEFIPNWYTSLENNLDKADILGMTMLYPNTSIIRDRGYQLVNIDGNISLQAIDRGKDISMSKANDVNPCDTVCGCFFFVKKEVFKKVPGFNEDGRNRWGEFIFTLEAIKSGATVGVINHCLYHHGHGTKINRNEAFSSTSYIVELPIWQKIVDHYVDKSKIRMQINTRFSSAIQMSFKKEKSNILIYGIGTVTEKLFSKVDIDTSRVTLCSGLQEEVGITVYTLKVYHISNIDLHNYDWILITPIHRGLSIYKRHIKDRVPLNYGGTISEIVLKYEENKTTYTHRKIIH